MTHDKGTERRALLVGFGGLAVGAALNAACQNQTSTNTQQASNQGQRRIVGPGGRVRIRKSISSLTREEIAAYADGIRKMRALPATHKHSLAAQAKIHGDSCKHESWIFLPWHRPYLAYFEEAFRAVTGNESFALPYWDWTADRKIPAPFADKSSPLFDSTRNADLVLADTLVGPKVINSALRTTLWETFMGGVSSEGREFSGDPEGVPHGSVHVAVGGNMLDFATTGLDPLFWTHHCNMDRLWEGWMKVNKTNSHPIKSSDTKWKALRLEGYWGRKQEAVTATTADTIDPANFGFGYDVLPQTSSNAANSPVTSLASVPPSQILNGTLQGGQLAFALSDALTARVNELGGGDAFALTGSQPNAFPRLGGSALLISGQFANGETIRVLNAMGDECARFTVFAHHPASSMLLRLSDPDLKVAAGGKLALSIVGQSGSPLEAQAKIIFY